MDEQAGNFYRDQTFQLIKGQLDRIESTQADQARDIANIKDKLSYIAGEAAILGLIGGSIISALALCGGWFMKLIRGQ